MSDKEVSSFYCNICGKSAKRDIKWFSPNGGRYYLCLAHCQDHGCLKAKARIKKCPKDMVYVVKTIKTIPEASTKDIREKYKSVQEKLLSQKWKSSNSDL